MYKYEVIVYWRRHRYRMALTSVEAVEEYMLEYKKGGLYGND